MKTTLLFLVAALSLAAADKPGKGWISMFDGKTLNGWEANENPGSWTVVDGTIQGKGDKSHLFWKKQECVDCEFKAEIKLAHGSNSGMYFRTAWGPGFPKGYEAQVNNTHKDPVKTGSLYNFVKVLEQKVQDDTWWTQQITVRGNHIVIKVNSEVVVDFHDDKNTFTKGYLALQQHDPKSVVQYKNLMFRPLKPEKK